MWSIEMAALKQAGSYYEVLYLSITKPMYSVLFNNSYVFHVIYSILQSVQCIRRIKILLGEVDSADRVKYCKPDYDAAVKALRKQKQVWSLDLFKEAVSVTIQFFSANHFQKLPVSLFIEILSMIPVEELPPLLCVSEEWYDLCTCNEAWSTFYRRKFLINNPGRFPTDEVYLLNAYRKRLFDPQVGDKIEVAWRGKFRLETSDVYQGLAWWVAEIVDKHPAQGRYKIRYPGWDSRWDEWVPRNRLRWKVARNTLVKLEAGDTVELWCCGANVPGAWLECKIKRVRNRRYCLGRVIANGFLWVGRERLRLVKRPNAVIVPGQVDTRRFGPQRSFFGSFIFSLSQRFQGLLVGSPPPVDTDADGGADTAVAAAEPVPAMGATQPDEDTATCVIM